MQNDVLKNNIAPWQEKGRWYHGVVDAGTKNFITEKTDSFINNDFTAYEYAPGNAIYINPADKKHIILDVKYKISSDFVKSTGAIINETYVTAGGKMWRAIAPTGTGTCEFWVFIVENK